MKKRILAALLAASMALCAGCGSQTSDDGEEQTAAGTAVEVAEVTKGGTKRMRCAKIIESGTTPDAMVVWPVGQAVKTEASHAFNIGSIPVRVTIFSNKTAVCRFI